MCATFPLRLVPAHCVLYPLSVPGATFLSPDIGTCPVSTGVFAATCARAPTSLLAPTHDVRLAASPACSCNWSVRARNGSGLPNTVYTKHAPSAYKAAVLCCEEVHFLKASVSLADSINAVRSTRQVSYEQPNTIYRDTDTALLPEIESSTIHRPCDTPSIDTATFCRFCYT